MSKLFEHLEVLHIPGSDLDDHPLREQIEMGQAHQFGHDGEAGLLFCEEEELDPAVMQSLERVRRGPGLEGTAPQQPCPAGFTACATRMICSSFSTGAGAGRQPQNARRRFSRFPQPGPRGR